MDYGCLDTCYVIDNWQDSLQPGNTYTPASFITFEVSVQLLGQILKVGQQANHYHCLRCNFYSSLAWNPSYNGWIFFYGNQLKLTSGKGTGRDRREGEGKRDRPGTLPLQTSGSALGCYCKLSTYSVKTVKGPGQNVSRGGGCATGKILVSVKSTHVILFYISVVCKAHLAPCDLNKLKEVRG